MIPLSRVSPPKAPQPQLPVATAERCTLLLLLRKNPQYAWDKCTGNERKERRGEKAIEKMFCPQEAVG